MGETEPLALGEESLLGDLPGPVRLICLLEVPKDTNTTRQTQLGIELERSGLNWTYGKPKTDD